MGAVLQQLSRRFCEVSEDPRFDAQILLADILGRSRAWVLAHPEARLSVPERLKIEQAARRREQGEPLPYLLGHWEFYGLDFILTPAVLIPRPETELLVEQALHWLKQNPARRWALDVGAGSGCISVSLAVRVPDLYVTAVDISAEALYITRQNAERHAVSDRVHLVQSDLIPPSWRQFDLICANLPYIPTGTLRHLPIYGREPSLALEGGLQGLDLIERLLHQAPEAISPDGLLLLEIEASQGETALALAHQVFPESDSAILADLSGRDRLLTIQT